MTAGLSRVHRSRSLVWAAVNGHKGAVKVPLEWDGVNPAKQDKRGRAPLLSDVFNKHKGVVKILVEMKRPQP